MFDITRVGNNIDNKKIREFIADKVSDVDLLPCMSQRGKQTVNSDSLNDLVDAGSSCFVIENSSVWMLGNDDVWHEI